MSNGEHSPEEVAEDATAFVVGLLDAFGLDGTVAASQPADGEIEIAVEGEGLGLLVGPKGQTLLAIQDLTRLVAQRHVGPGSPRLGVDVGGYRQRRVEALRRFSLQVAAQVVETGLPKSLEPMAAADRKVVHDALTDVTGVSTLSEGEEPYRRVVIVPEAAAAEDPARRSVMDALAGPNGAGDDRAGKRARTPDRPRPTAQAPGGSRRRLGQVARPTVQLGRADRRSRRRPPRRRVTRRPPSPRRPRSPCRRTPPAALGVPPEWPAVLAALAEAQARGFVGDGQDLDALADHARGFVGPIAGATRVVDLGSGGGVPGLVIAALCPAATVTLLDASVGRTDWLRRIVGRLGWRERVWWSSPGEPRSWPTTAAGGGATTRWWPGASPRHW